MISLSISLDEGDALPVVFIGFKFFGSSPRIKNRPKNPLKGEYRSQKDWLTSPLAIFSKIGKYKLCVTIK